MAKLRRAIRRPLKSEAGQTKFRFRATLHRRGAPPAARVLPLGEENPLVDSFTGGFSYDWHGAINVPGARSRRVVGASSGMGGYRAGRSTYWRREIAAPIVAAFQSTKS